MGPGRTQQYPAIPVVPCSRLCYLYYTVKIRTIVFTCQPSHKPISSRYLLYIKSYHTSSTTTATNSWHWGPASSNGEAEHPLSAIITRAPTFHHISYHTWSSGLRDKTLPMTTVITLYRRRPENSKTFVLNIIVKMLTRVSNTRLSCLYIS